ncbi:hypothetical protein pb186bvf_019122 [Paramecium bursaria]
MKGFLCKSPMTNKQNYHDNQGVKVVCRIRPPHKGEKYVSYKISQNSLDIPTGPVCNIQDRQNFTFSDICDTKVNQQSFYLANVSPLIKSVFEQNKGALIFTYGVTNSGKTYTVVGTNNEPGILIQTMRELYKIRNDVRQLKSQIIGDCGLPIQIDFDNYLLDSIEYSFQCMEIYNSDVYDLLQQTGQKIKLQLKEIDKRCIAKDCSEYKINEISEFMELYQRALLNKKMAETSLNQMSSRSHTIYKLFVNTIFKDNEHVIQRRNTICIVDLAGSERSKKATTSGQQLAEACNINQSLLTLGKCLKSMARYGQDPSQVVPFRECKLTKILSEYFTVENYILMILNVQLTQQDIDETAKVLKYGALSVNIQLLKPRLYATNIKFMKKPSVDQIVNYQVGCDNRIVEQGYIFSEPTLLMLQNTLNNLSPNQGLLNVQRKLNQKRLERINAFVQSKITIQNGQLTLIPIQQQAQYDKQQRYFSCYRKQVQNPDEIFERFSQLDLEGKEIRLRLLDQFQIENLKVKEDRQMEEINEIVISDINQFDQQQDEEKNEQYDSGYDQCNMFIQQADMNQFNKENQGNYHNIQQQAMWDNSNNVQYAIAIAIVAHVPESIDITCRKLQYVPKSTESATGISELVPKLLLIKYSESLCIEQLCSIIECSIHSIIWKLIHIIVGTLLESVIDVWLGLRLSINQLELIQVQ